jgi:hypothetical protein
VALTFVGMTFPASRIATVTAAVAVAATLLGCGVLSQVKQAASNITTISDLAEKLGKADKLTFTAEYKLSDGSVASVVQQPPNSAYVGRNGRFIVTADAFYLCGTGNGAMSCQKTANTGGSLDAANAGLIPSVAGAGFVSAPIALALLTAASISPGAKVDKTERKIAGQSSTCIKVSGIKGDNDPSTSDVKDFSACVTDSGLLASFSGDLNNGEHASIEMTRYSGSADAKAFAPPAGAQVVDVDRLQPAG